MNNNRKICFPAIFLKLLFRFDPVNNIWDYVGDLPEPRHHHSVAFLKGKVYLVGKYFLPNTFFYKIGNSVV